MTLKQLVGEADIVLHFDVYLDDESPIDSLEKIASDVDYTWCCANPKVGNRRVNYWTIMRGPKGIRVCVAVESVETARRNLGL